MIYTIISLRLPAYESRIGILCSVLGVQGKSKVVQIMLVVSKTPGTTDINVNYEYQFMKYA